MNKLRFKNSNADLFFVEEMSDKDLVAVEFLNGQKAQVIKLSEGKYITCGIGEKNTYCSRIAHSSIYDVCCGASVKASYRFDSRKDIIEFLID